MLKSKSSFVLRNGTFVSEIIAIALILIIIHLIGMRLLLSNPNLGHRLEANHIGSKMPSDSIEPKEWQKPHWLEDSNESKKLQASS